MKLEPQETMVFKVGQTSDRARLQKWLHHSEVIIGMNLPFDIQYLRRDPFFRFALRDQLLVDLSVLNYLHDETRPEKSLKNLGPVLHTHSYDETIKTVGRFEGPSDPRLAYYNAQDTHNTVLAVQELARRIFRDFPGTYKLSPFCLDFYSDLLWTIIRMSEAGVSMHREELITLEKRLLSECEAAHESASNQDLPLEGPGSGKAKEEFMEFLCDTIDEINGVGDASQSVRTDPLLQLTPAKGIISFSESNRNLLAGKLPTDHPQQQLLKEAKKHASAQKLVSSYTYPLLRHRRNKPSDQSSVILKQNGHHVAYPTWYAVPTFAKDAAGPDGGTLQGRITCKKPSVQTFPDQVKSCIISRFEEGTIMSMDLSQIELRVAALLSGDNCMTNAFVEDEDLHNQRASQIFGPDFEKMENTRQAAKMINFADLYRSGAPTMQAQLLGMTGLYFDLDFFRGVVAARPVHRPGLWAFQNSLIGRAEETGRVELPFTGQSRYFLGGDKFEVNEIVNFPVQTTAGNTLLQIQAYLHKNLPNINTPTPEIKMFLNIYDAIYFDVAPGHEEELRQLVWEAVHYVEMEGYWAMLEEHYGNTIPLRYTWS